MEYEILVQLSPWNVNIQENHERKKITWFVISYYDFEPYPCNYYSEFKVKDGAVLTIDDGLSHYIAEKGWAEEFYYGADWEEICPLE